MTFNIHLILAAVVFAGLMMHGYDAVAKLGHVDLKNELLQIGVLESGKDKPETAMITPARKPNHS